MKRNSPLRVPSAKNCREDVTTVICRRLAREPRATLVVHLGIFRHASAMDMLIGQVGSLSSTVKNAEPNRGTTAWWALRKLLRQHYARCSAEDRRRLLLFAKREGASLSPMQEAELL